MNAKNYMDNAVVNVQNAIADINCAIHVAQENMEEIQDNGSLEKIKDILSDQKTKLYEMNVFTCGYIFTTDKTLKPNDVVKEGVFPIMVFSKSLIVELINDENLLPDIYVYKVKIIGNKQIKSGNETILTDKVVILGKVEKKKQKQKENKETLIVYHVSSNEYSNGMQITVKDKENANKQRMVWHWFAHAKKNLLKNHESYIYIVEIDRNKNENVIRDGFGYVDSFKVLRKSGG